MGRRTPTPAELDDALAAFNKLDSGWIPIAEDTGSSIRVLDPPKERGGSAPRILRFRLADGRLFELRLKKRWPYQSDVMVAAQPITRHDVRQAFVIESPVLRPQGEPAF